MTKFNWVSIQDQLELDMYHDWHMLEYGYYPTSYYYKFCIDNEKIDINIDLDYKSKHANKWYKRAFISLKKERIKYLHQKRIDKEQRSVRNSRPRRSIKKSNRVAHLTRPDVVLV